MKTLELREVKHIVPGCIPRIECQAHLAQSSCSMYNAVRLLEFILTGPRHFRDTAKENKPTQSFFICVLCMKTGQGTEVEKELIWSVTSVPGTMPDMLSQFSQKPHTMYIHNTARQND